MATATQLSRNDSAVLGALFDPEASLSSIHQTSRSNDSAYDHGTLQRIRELERQALQSSNTAHPSLADLQRSIILLDKLIETYPKYASAYSNRAQARRMLYDVDDLQNHPEALSLILVDLASAIRLASSKHASDTVPSDNARVLAAAYTHRAFLLYTASKLTPLGTAFAGVESMSGPNGDPLEELASRDFAAGGRYGNRVAKQLAVKTNPYAKLCGSIVKEAMRRELEHYGGR